MTYRELLLQAEFKLDHNDITLGEFEQMIAPLNREVDVLDKIRAEIDRQEKWLLQAGYIAYNVDIAFDAIKAVLAETR